MALSAIALALIWFAARPLIAQATVPDEFNPGASGPVYAFAIQGDQRIVVAGAFSSLGGQSRSNIGRLHPDGSLDHTFQAQANSVVTTAAIQEDGKILVGGAFASLGEQQHRYIGRLAVDGTPDNSFNADANNRVITLAVQKDGKVLAGGLFTLLNEQPRIRIGRFHPDGTLDSAFNPSAGSAVQTLALQPDGRILVGGNFTSMNGERRDYVARLHEDGSLDASFDPGADAQVRALAVQPDGKILVGGSFTSLEGQPRGYLGRLHPDGSLDSAFDPALNGTVVSLVLQSDGKILVGGAFTSLNGQPGGSLGRLHGDGSLDATFSLVANGSVASLALQSDGSVLLGGNFSSVGGMPRAFLGRLTNPVSAEQSIDYDGSTLTWLRGGSSPEAWRVSFESSDTGSVWALLGDGARVSGGWQFTGVQLPSGAFLRARAHVSGGNNNATSWYVERMLGNPVIESEPASRTNTAGTTATFSVAATGGRNLDFQWLKDGLPLQSQNNIAGATGPELTLSQVGKSDEGGYRVVVTDTFGVTTSMVATLTVLDPFITQHPAGTHLALGDDARLEVQAVGTPPLSYQWYRDNIPVAGATTQTLALTNVSRLDFGSYTVAVCNAHGCTVSSPAWVIGNAVRLDTAFYPRLSPDLNCLAVQPDGKIILGGSFIDLEGQTRSRVGRLHPDGTLDPDFNPTANGVVHCLGIQPDGRILVAGTFTAMNGEPRARIARIFEDGHLDESFDPGANGPITSLALEGDGGILVCGAFTMLGGQSSAGMGRINPGGTLDTGFNPIPNGPVRALAVQENGDILAGGEFTAIDGHARVRIARIHKDGALDTSFDPGADGSVFVLVSQVDGRILAGGEFTSLGGQPRSHLARILSSGMADPGFIADANDAVRTLALQADGKILAGGDFTEIGGGSRERLARLDPDGAVDELFDGGADHTVNLLALQPDGHVLVGGFFTILSGAQRTYLGRLINTDPAIQTLAREGTDLIWTRGGTSPELRQVEFESSSDTLEWTFLGAGSRMPGGWRLSGANPPLEGWVRARGLVAGDHESSVWFAQGYLGRPLSLSQPASRTNIAGTHANFHVAAGGSEPMSFQWFKDGLPLLESADTKGVNTATLTLAQVLKADQGTYTVSVVNELGGIISSEATLTVLDPYILRHPGPTNRVVGEDVTLEVVAAGSAPLNYQWYLDGRVLSGEVGSTLALQNLEEGHGGFYTVVVRNSHGLVMSVPALLLVNSTPLDASFKPQLSGHNVEVYSFAIQTDGKILFGGYFESVGGRSRSGLAQIQADGTLDETFNLHFSPRTFALAIQPDGKILAGTEYLPGGPSPQSPIRRLHPDGLPDLGFDANANGQVNCIVVQPDGKIVVGGQFTTLNGQARRHIGRLHADGTLDTAFDPDADNSVLELAQQADGKLLVAGFFANLAGQPRAYLARLEADGTLDIPFNPGANGSVGSLAIQPDGKILAGGSFTVLGGQPRSKLARLNTDGTLDASFLPGINRDVYSIAVQADGKIFIGGRFSWSIVRLLPNGAIDGFIQSLITGPVFAVALQADGGILGGGSFWEVDGQFRPGLVRFSNLAASRQSLGYDGTDLTWLRSGAIPELWRATFEYSDDDTNWVRLGDASRIPGGWCLAEVGLPLSGKVRVRGQVAGSRDASEWFVESETRAPWPLRVRLVWDGASMILSWPAGPGPFQVQQTPNTGQPNSWQDLGEPIHTNSIALPVAPQSFFLRVRGP